MNPYLTAIDKFFLRLTTLRHGASMFETAIANSRKAFASWSEYPEDMAISASSLVISDLTGPSDQGWVRNFHTGATVITYKNEYDAATKTMLSQHYCYSFIQAFEALERLMKDTMAIYSANNVSYVTETERVEGGIKPKEINLYYKIFKIIGQNIRFIDKYQGYKVGYKELWTVLSKSRNAITHCISNIEKAEVDKSKIHKKYFHILFPDAIRENEVIKINLTHKQFMHSTKVIGEFGFQIFKGFSIVGDLKWDHIMEGQAVPREEIIINGKKIKI